MSMRLALCAAAAAIALSMTIALSSAAEPSEKTILNVYAWTDSFDSDVVNQFQRRYDCEVHLDYFTTNEELLKELTNPEAAYDVITPSAYILSSLRDKGIIMPLAHNKIPNIKYVDKRALPRTEDPQMKYSIPFTNTVTGIGYNSTRVTPDQVASWRVFGNANFAGRMALLADIRECFAVALLTLGHSVNSTDPLEIREAGRLLAEWRKTSKLIGAEDAMELFLDGELDIIHIYNGDAALMTEDTPDIAFVVPKEGALLVSDDFVISASTPVPDLAYAFINHMLDPEMARRNMESVMDYMPNTEAFAGVSKELRSNAAFLISHEDLARTEPGRNVGSAIAIYEKVWNEVLQAK